MKRLITLVLVLSCVAGLVGCNSKYIECIVDNKANLTGTVQNEGVPTSATEDITPGGIPIEETLNVAVSYANWTEDGKIYAGSLNKEKMSISSVHHLPIYKFSTLEELDQFKVSFGEVLTMDGGYDEIPSFDNITTNYDETFFVENTLMLVYVEANNCTHRYWVNSIFCNGTSFCIHVEETTGTKEGDTAMIGWFLTVVIPDSMVENCTEFDAVFDNTET